MLRLLSVAVLSLPAVTTLRGDAPADLVTLAQERFEEGKEVATDDPDAARKLFRAAGDGFALAAEAAGDPGAAHYNAGNAFTFSGDVGEAVFHFRMAQLFHPFDPNIAHNLENARRQVLDAVTERPTRSVVDLGAAGARFVSAWVRALLFVLGYAGLFGIVVAMFLWGRSAMKKLAVGCGVLVAVAGLSLLVEWWVCQGGRDGVVVVDEVVARTGDGEVYPWAFTSPLHAGVEFRIRERRGDWVRVELWSGDEGWLPATAARMIEPADGR